MKIKYAERGEIIPDWRDNLEQPVEAQIKVDFKFVSSEVRQRFFYQKDIKASQSQLADGDLSIEMRNDYIGLARASDVKIFNFEVEDDKGNCKKIDTLEKLEALPDSFGANTLVSKIATEISKAQEINQKN